jgi:ATP-dependent Clp protease adaptor protein ClpS
MKAQTAGHEPMKRVSRNIMRRLAQGDSARSEHLLVSGPGPQAPGGGDDGGRSNTAIVTKTKPRTKRPNLYRVLLLNDDYTPMEFVVHVLERFFNKNREDATRIMLHVHQNGVGECGVFTYEVAETKVTQVMDFARKHQHPLQCVMEKN